MSVLIDPGPVLVLRKQEEREAAQLRDEINSLKERLSLHEARISALDQVLQQCRIEVAPAPEPVIPAASLSLRQPRASAQNMSLRRAAVIQAFRQHDFLLRLKYSLHPKPLFHLPMCQLHEI